MSFQPCFTADLSLHKNGEERGEEIRKCGKRHMTKIPIFNTLWLFGDSLVSSKSMPGGVQSALLNPIMGSRIGQSADMIRKLY